VISKTEAPILIANKLCAWHGAAQILFDVSLQVGRGEVVALLGSNGAGKSTTLKALMGLLKKRRGHVKFFDHNIATKDPHEIARLGMGYVPEDRRVSSDLTVMENLEVGRRPARSWAIRFWCCRTSRRKASPPSSSNRWCK
jgi:branched-chain amino acid transport system ATP-binding protein